jgi:hypothetical protein
VKPRLYWGTTMSEHRHEWYCGWDSFVCECGAERSFSDDGLVAIVVTRGTEERLVNAILDEIRKSDDG